MHPEVMIRFINLADIAKNAFRIDLIRLKEEKREKIISLIFFILLYFLYLLSIFASLQIKKFLNNRSIFLQITKTFYKETILIALELRCYDDCLNLASIRLFPDKSTLVNCV